MAQGIGWQLVTDISWQTYQFHLQGSSSPTAWSLKMGLLGSPETSVTSCQPVLWIPEERKPNYITVEALKTCSLILWFTQLITWKYVVDTAIFCNNMNNYMYSAMKCKQFKNKNWRNAKWNTKCVWHLAKKSFHLEIQHVQNCTCCDHFRPTLMPCIVCVCVCVCVSKQKL
jgi:hypothetical protein